MIVAGELLPSLDRLVSLLEQRGALVLTGAGCSTESGIPDYRDLAGNWKRRQPVTYQDFMRSVESRRRYWARSFAGWPSISGAVPNAAHAALAVLERAGYIRGLITQNVDGLHQKAGAAEVIDLHGRLDTVICTACGEACAREAFQQALARSNPDWTGMRAAYAPDGDADLAADFSGYRVPSCAHCGGILKPDVVFFGESVPRPRVDRALEWVARSRVLVVVGSSLMVWSGFRFVRAACDRGLPIAVVNLGRTRADELLHVKVEAPCGEVLAYAARRLAGNAGLESSNEIRTSA